MPLLPPAEGSARGRVDEESVSFLPAKALEVVEKASEIFKEINYPEGEGLALFNEGFILFKQGHLDKAIEKADYACTLLRKTEHRNYSGKP